MAVALFLVAQVNLILALAAAVGLLLGGIVVTFARVEYLLHVLIVIPLVEGLDLGPITIGRAASVGALGAVIGAILLTDWRPVRTRLSLWLPSIALVAWAILSGLWAGSTGAYLFGIGQLGVAVSVLVVTALVLRGVATFTSVMHTFVVVAALTVLPATLQSMAGQRAVGLHANPNQYAQGLVLALLALAYLVRLRGIRQSGPLLLLAPVLIWGTIATGSRMGLLVLVGAGLLVAYDFAPRANRARVMAASVLILAVGFLGVTSTAERYDPRNVPSGIAVRRASISGSSQSDRSTTHPCRAWDSTNSGVRPSSSWPANRGLRSPLVTSSSPRTASRCTTSIWTSSSISGSSGWRCTCGRLAERPRGLVHANPPWRGPAARWSCRCWSWCRSLCCSVPPSTTSILWMLIGVSIAMNALPWASGCTGFGPDQSLHGAA